ncbi:hypothetical protein QR685DRAFT_596914 [Neurospora intermedia]|uniref:Uncharacterized protein n=1 Tax=Neurospora intermedia TaxID=5142 RepID=A0ABR3DC07_NEUIN
MVVGCSAGHYPMTSMVMQAANPHASSLELRPPSFTQSVKIPGPFFSSKSSQTFHSSQQTTSPKVSQPSDSTDSRWEFPIWQELWRLPAAALREKGRDGDYPQTKWDDDLENKRLELVLTRKDWNGLIDVEIVSDAARSASRIGSAPTTQGRWLGTGILKATG